MTPIPILKRESNAEHLERLRKDWSMLSGMYHASLIILIETDMEKDELSLEELNKRAQAVVELSQGLERAFGEYRSFSAAMVGEDWFGKLSGEAS